VQTNVEQSSTHLSCSLKNNMSSKTFCIVPWIHLHTWPDGRVIPCCIMTPDKAIGNLKDNTLEELWNSQGMKDMRSLMLSGEKVSACNRCYQTESNGLVSHRQNSNQFFNQHIEWAETNTNQDGSVDKLNLIYWDFRFSNICNLKCRSCGPNLSSTWYDDHVKMAPGYRKEPRVIHVEDNSKENIFRYVDQLIDTVEEVYFAGGEPLVMPEHYDILEKLIAAGRTDCRLRYNTNLSKLTFRGKNVMDYWQQFEKVKVYASIDAIGARAEYLRSGTDWTLVEENIKTIVNFDKNVMAIGATVQLANVLHLPEMVDHLLNLGVKYVTISLSNILSWPNYYSIQILPEQLKQQAKQQLLAHLDTMEKDIRKIFEPQYNGIINFMQHEPDNKLQLQQEFKQKTQQLDSIRHEELSTCCPELKEWYQSI
jgi:radical SAM protein with 4Fe4S-binding SPASM domain